MGQGHGSVPRQCSSSPIKQFLVIALSFPGTGPALRALEGATAGTQMCLSLDKFPWSPQSSYSRPTQTQPQILNASLWTVIKYPQILVSVSGLGITCFAVKFWFEWGRGCHRTQFIP